MVMTMITTMAIMITIMIVIIILMTVMTCDKRPLLVKVLGDTIQPGQIDDSQAKACRVNVIMQDNDHT